MDKDAAGVTTLFTSKNTKLGMLAGAVAGNVRKVVAARAGVTQPAAAGGSPVVLVSAMGPEACQLAVHAVARAREFLKLEIPNEELTVMVERKSDKPAADGSPQEYMSLAVHLLPRSALDSKRDVLVVHVPTSTNVAKSAAFVANTIAEGSTPSLRPVGPAATSQALKAVVIARSFVEADSTKTAQAGVPASDMAVVARELKAQGTREDRVAMVKGGAHEPRKRALELALDCYSVPGVR